MTRPKYRGKPKRGGGKSFSRDLAPLTAEDMNGSADRTPDKWAARDKQADEDDDSSDEDSDEEEEEEEDDGSEGEEDGGANEGAIGSSSTRRPKTASSAPISEIENPNRVANKTIKVSELGKQARPTSELSRREREAIQAVQAKQRYDKLHAEGKTDQAKADLARLKAVREQREAAAAKRKEDTQEKEKLSKEKLEKSGRSMKRS